MEIWDAAIQDYKNALLINPHDVVNRTSFLNLITESKRYDDAFDGKIKMILC